MDFRTELAKWGYNKGNSIDVEILVEEILPELFSKKQIGYSQEEVLEHLNHLIIMRSSELDLYTNDEEMITVKWFDKFKK